MGCTGLPASPPGWKSACPAHLPAYISLISHTTISWRKTQNHVGLPAQSPAPLPLHLSLHSDNVQANGTSFPQASRKLGLGGDGGERCLLVFLSTTQSSDSEGEHFQTSKSKYGVIIASRKGACHSSWTPGSWWGGGNVVGTPGLGQRGESHPCCIPDLRPRSRC